MRMPGQPWVAAGLYNRLQYEFTTWLNGRPILEADESKDYFILKALSGELWIEQMKGLLSGTSYFDMKKLALDLFYEVLKIDAPIQEFIQFNLTFSNVPRAFVDQLDRQRDTGFWEQSVRVKDLSKFADAHEYFDPQEVRNNPKLKEKYDQGMKFIQDLYGELLANGMRPESARGIVPMHVNVRADMTVNLRVMMEMVSKRTCYFAQGDYWRPVINSFLNDLMTSNRSSMPRDPRTIKMFTALPCDKKGMCPYTRDLMDRLVDKSNPICPILFEKYLSEEEQERTVMGMERMYGTYNWDNEGRAYLTGLQRDTMPFIEAVRRISLRVLR
jgi:hypothetical protein